MSKIAASILTIIAFVIALFVAFYHPSLAPMTMGPTFFYVGILIFSCLLIIGSLGSLFWLSYKKTRGYHYNNQSKPKRVPYFRIALNFVLAIIVSSWLIAFSVSLVNIIAFKAQYTTNYFFNLRYFAKEIAKSCGLSQNSVEYYRGRTDQVYGYISPNDSSKGDKGVVLIQCPTNIGSLGLFPKIVKISQAAL